MKRYTSLIAGGILILLCNDLRAKEDDVLSLVERGEARAALALPAHPHPDEELAAQELRTYVERISGVRLEMAYGQAPSDLIPVRIGRALNPAAAEDLRRFSTDPDAFVVSVERDGVRLVGNSPEGTLFAAYELLERLGVRWYMPGELGTVVPHSKEVELPLGRIQQTPSFPHRHLQTVSRQLPWYRRQRLGGAYFPSAHGISLLPPADFETEPELFALVDGRRSPRQLCVSNPEVVERAAAFALDYFERHPEQPWIGMGPNDGGGFCECDRCRALDSGEWDPHAAEPSVTDRYIWFFNQVLERVHQKYPDKKICFYAYHAYLLPPRRQKPDPHIVPALAPIDFCRIHGLSNPICPDRSFYGRLMTEWGRLVPEVFERGYYFNLADPGFPFSKIHAIRDETPFAHRAGITGWRVECMPSWATDTPTLYVAARLMWDVDADVDAMLEEFYAKFFGPAAEPMGRYLEMLDAAFRDTDCHTGGSFCLPRIFPPERRRQARSLLEEAERLAGRDEVYSQRVRIYRLNQARLEAFLEMIEARNRFDFASAREALERLRQLTRTLLDFRLYPDPAGEAPIEKFDSRMDREARLLWWRSAFSYLDRFWSPCTESGYERTVVRGEFAAGCPDEWDFLIDPADVGEASGWFRDGPVGGNWQKLRTTSASWSDQGLHYYKGTAWYRTWVEIPERFRGRRIYLWFGGVDEKAKVWLNGRLLGTNEHPGHGLPGVAGTFLPFEFDATEAVRFGRPNALAVRIDNEQLNEVGTGGIVAPVMFWAPREE